MKLVQINNEEIRKEFADKGYKLPAYDRDEVRASTANEPVWVHFGTGNIFRAFPAAVIDSLLNSSMYDKGVIAVEGFDYDIISKAYKPFDDLSLLVTLKSDGSIEKKVVGSVTESLTADFSRENDFARLKEIFTAQSLQMVSFTITEKGYSLNGPDGSLAGVVKDDYDNKCFPPKHLMGKIAYLLNERYKAGGYPVAMASMDNCSHNGDKLKAAVFAYAEKWLEQGLVDEGFISYLKDESKVSFPLSMIDKITPRPDGNVVEMLKKDGFEDTDIIITDKNTYTAAFVNAEETQYLVVEDKFPNGRPPFDKGGVYFTDRETVDKVEKMKVCTCLNPLHTALAVFGCLLSYDTIWKEMKDEDLSSFVREMGYKEGMPVVIDPGIIKPATFIDEVLNKRLVNPFMPDTPQRIACDTSQKLPIRFGETLKAYMAKGEDVSGLHYIPVVLAGYLRYLTGINDEGNEFDLSPDPLLSELTGIMAAFRGYKAADAESLKPVLSRKDIFAVDLYEAGLAQIITGLFNRMNEGPGMVRKVLHETVTNK
ncbi:MAG: mannitol dehydrogenase family protein [Lachnospiraceae bacterium]|nr:mannitol dehydrogenase family protein [Lachnospiraceae bacterium]